MLAFVVHPTVLFLTLLFIFIAAVAFGAFILRRALPLPDHERDDFNVVQTSTLTLLALLIGFSLSMAVGRYDTCKDLEENEANAIGTEYARADLADAAISAQMKRALVEYTRLRLAHFKTRDPQEIARNERETTELQTKLWEMASQVAKAVPTPISATVATGMNDALNSQEYSEAALINRIPLGTWPLMIAIALFACVVQRIWDQGKAGGGFNRSTQHLEFA